MYSGPLCPPSLTSVLVGIPAFAAGGGEDVGKLGVGGEFGGEPVEHLLLIGCEGGPPGADGLGESIGGGVEDGLTGGGGKRIAQPGGDDGGLLDGIKGGDVGG